MANLGSGNDNINIDGATSSFVDFGGADTYTILSSLSGDVTITDNQASTINLPVGLTISDALFLSDGVQFTIGGNTVTLIGNPALYTFVFGGTPLDPTAGTPLSFEDTAVAFGTTVPAPGEAPNAATSTGDVNDDGTVGADDGLVGLSIADASVVEGDTGNTAMEFTITLDEAATDDVTFDFNTEALTGDAEAGVDYVGTAVSPVTIAAGDTTATVTVDVIGDLGIEADETFGVTISNASANATITTGTATGTIIDDDTPTFELTGPATVNEADGATYTVTASKPVPVDTDVIFQVAAGDASAPDQGTNNTNLNDFAQGAFTATTVTILAGQTTAEFVVASKDDGITELSEDFSVSATVDGTDLGSVTSTILDGATIGDTFFLTENADEIIIETAGTIDTVRGLINDDGTDDLDTFSTADIIEGNGLTEVRITLVDTSGSPGGDADFVEMEGVNTLDFRGAGATSAIDFDASTYGSDLNNFLLSGADGADVDVENVELDGGPIMVEIAEGTAGDLSVTGSSELFSTFAVTISSTSTSEGGGTVISDIGGAGLDIMAGEDTTITYSATMSVSETGDGNASIDARSIGDISLVAGPDASVDAYSFLYVNVGGSGDATIGDVTLGDVSIVAGSDSGSVSYQLSRSASADTGDATIGNLTVGDINVTMEDDAYEAFVFLTASAEVTGTGNASVGDTTIGDVNFMVGDSVEDYLTVEIDNYARVNGSGNATVGDVLVGDIMMEVGDTADSTINFSVSQEADVTGTGDATVGSITFGNIDVLVGDSLDDYIEITADQHAEADDGNATVGDITIGTQNIVMGTSGSYTLDIDNEADATSGDAMVGSITLGDITFVAGTSSEMNFEIDASADASTSGDAIVGDISVGSITGVLDVSAELDLSVTAQATGTGTMTAIGDVTIGDITLNGPVAISVTADINVDLDSDGTIGALSVGAVDIDFLDNSDVDYEINLTTSGSDDAIGPVNLGDVDIVAESIDYEVSMYGDLTAGVTIGDVMLSGDDIDWQSIYMYASEEIGDVVVGDIMIDAAVSVSVSSGVYVSATDDIGSVTIGDVMIDAPNSETFTVFVDTSRDLLGDVTIGDVGLMARSGAFLINADINVSGDSGDVIVGDVSLTATDSATAQFSVDASATGTAGDVTIGDISLAASVSATTASASVNFDALSDGNLTVGDITMSAEYVGTADVTGTAAALGALSLDVSLSASDDITVGDISVVGGGVANTAATGAITDNLGTLTSWFTATAGGDVTIGDVDYSGYANDAMIDVSGFLGAENITAGDGDTDITVNDTTNNVTLGAGADDVIYTADEQSGTTYAEIDKIIDFTSGSDDIDLTFITGTSVAIGATVADYDAFLTTAQQVMTNFGDDVVTLNDGTNTYVGVDSDNDSTLDFAIELTGITTVTTGDFIV